MKTHEEFIRWENADIKPEVRDKRRFSLTYQCYSVILIFVMEQPFSPSIHANIFSDHP